MNDNSIVALAKETYNEVTGYSSAQQIGGVSILNYSVSSSAQYDYYFRIYQSDPGKQFRLTFAQSQGDKLALLRLMIFAREGNPDVMASPIPYTTPTAAPLFVRWRKDMPIQKGRTSWRFLVAKGHFGVEYYDAYLKFFINGTDTGSWTITPL